MKICAIKTKKVVPGVDKSIFDILERYLPRLKEKTVVAVTSKVVAICEGRIIPFDERKKDSIIKSEADWYLPRTSHKYNVMLTIKGNAMSFSSGVDESNAKGYFVLWPKNPQKSANDIRRYLIKKHHLKLFL